MEEENNMFDLEESIARWRMRMMAAGVRHPEVLDEMESHLRDDWERRTLLGEGAEEAFKEAARGIGEPRALYRELKRSGAKKWGWMRRLKAFVAEALDPAPCLNALTPAARRTLDLAGQEAPRMQHGFIGTEHVLLGLLALEEGGVANILRKLGVDRARLKERIEGWIKNFPSCTMPPSLPFTPRVKKSLRLAATEAKRSGAGCVTAEHIFLGLFLEGDGVAARVLREFGLSRAGTRRAVSSELNRSY